MFFASKIGIDLGTVNCLVTVPGQGIVLQLPTVVAREIHASHRLKKHYVGEAARRMEGKTAAGFRVIYPLKEGVIADFQATALLLAYIFQRVLKPWHFVRPQVVISTSVNSNSAERRALLRAALEAGAGQVYLVLEPLLAMLGSGNNRINEPEGQLLVHIGGGVTQVAVISMGSIVTCEAVRVGGRAIDAKIQELLRRKFGLQISLHTAEQIKMAIGSVNPSQEEILEFRGTDVLEGLPKEVEVSSLDVAQILRPFLEEIVGAIKKVLARTTPEILADIMDNGMILTGGGAQLPGLKEYLTEEVKLGVSLAKDPALCVARGTGEVLSNLRDYRETLLQQRLR